MPRRVAVVFVVLAVLIGGGVLVVWINQSRVESARLNCSFNMYRLAQFADQQGGSPLQPVERGAAAWAIPPGTVPNPALDVPKRLSWIVPLLPHLDQKRQDTASLFAQVDLSQPWDAEPHRSVARTQVNMLLCPGRPEMTAADALAVTQYVGNGGVGESAPTYTPAPTRAPPNAGCFRYDGPTPAAAIVDGLSETVLMLEMSAPLGPWMQGGPSTVRTLDAGANAKPPIGAAGQFGGNHLGGMNLGFADLRVTFFTDRTSPVVLHKLMTIAGDEAGLPGE